jgi:predicted permease
VALALVLLFGASQMIQGFARLSRRDLGFETAELVTAKIATGELLSGEEERRAFVAALEAELLAIPGVSAAGLSSVNPLCCGDWGAVISVEGLERPADAPPLVVHHRLATPGLFGALGVTLLRGRLLQPGDSLGSEPVVVVDARLAERFWPGADPLGRRLKRGRPDSEHPWLRVVGVVSAVDDTGDYTETWYLPWAQNPLAPSGDMLHPMLRTTLPPIRLAPELRAAVARVQPGVAVFDTSGMDAIRAGEIAEERLGTQLIGAFGAFGLLLAAVGLYGVLALATQRRRGEIGVRLALGAAGSSVVGLVLRDGLRLLLAGTTLGLGASAVLARLLRALPLQRGPFEPAPAALALLLLAAAALAACWIPARRAAAVDPLEVLREG